MTNIDRESAPRLDRRAKLSQSQRAEVVRLYRESATVKSLADTFGVSGRHIYTIVSPKKNRSAEVARRKELILEDPERIERARIARNKAMRKYRKRLRGSSAT